MTRCSTGRATQKYRGNGTDLSDILETPGDIIYADAAVSAENLVISGTTGDVLKVSASGIPEWGTSTSQWITSGDDISYSLGHVGIGTTSPDANLHVTGNAFVSTDLGLGGTLTMGNVLVEALHELSAITATGNVTPHVIEFTNPTTGLVTTGNVGIKTSTPLQTLEVNGSVGIKHDGVGGYTFHTSTGAMRAGIHSSAGNHILFKAGANNERMRLLASGELGIGTSTPSKPLTVDGNVHIPSGSDANSGSFPQNSVTRSIYFGGISQSGSMYQSKTAIVSAPWTQYGGTQSWGRHGLHFCVDSVADNGNVELGQTKMCINYLGNVGIGSWSTSNPLPQTMASVHGGRVLEGRDALGFEFIAASSDTTNQPGQFNGAFLIKNMDANGSTPHYSGMAAREGATTTAGQMDLLFYSGRDNYENNTPQMVIDPDGNVGIGTSTPGYTLDVTGDINFTGNLIQNGSAYGSSPWTTTGNDISYTTGRVGVGTISPDANLHVEGNVYMSSNLEVGGATISRTVSYDVPSVSWATSIGGTNSDYGYGIATDSNGNVYVIGKYSGTVTIGSTTLNSAGSSDAFVAKYDTSGTVQWAKSIGGTSSDAGQAIATDSNGNVYVIGFYNNTATFAPGTTLTTAGYTDTFVAKYDTSGTVQWAESIGGTYFDYGQAIATDSAGNVYVTGYYNGSVTIGTITLTSTGSNDTFVAKYNTSGTVQWAKSIGGTDTDYGYGIATDSNGNVYVIGFYNNTVTFAPGTTLNSTGGDDAFVAKYDTSGTVQWAKSIGGTGSDNGRGIATDSNGNVYVTGKYSTTATFAPGTTLTSVGSSDAFVAKYNTSGTVQWAMSIGGTSSDYGQAIATDSAGNVYVTGYYSGSVTIGSTTLNSAGSTDAFVAKYNTSGTVQWAMSIGGTSPDYGYGIATDSGGNVYVTGYYRGSVTIGSTTLNSVGGSNDTFVVKYSPPIALHINKSVDVTGDINFTGNLTQNGSAYGGGGSGSSLWTESSGDIQRSSGNVEVGVANLFVNTTTSRVGIGTSTPGYTLDVTGDINFTGTLTQNGSAYGGGSSLWVTSGNDISYTTGRVGVGTTSPDANLHVEGNVYMSSNLNVGPTALANIAYQQQGKIQASDAQAYDSFGYSVSISGDGNTALVGAYLEDPSGTDAGAAYVFTRSSGTWTQQQKIQASDAQAYDSFGYSVSLSSDGNTALVGAYREDTGGTDAGAAYIFTRSSGTWTQQQKIIASDAQAYDSFGHSVSLSSDGNTALVGAWREDTGASSAGAAYIFTRSSGTWTQQQKIQASDAQGSDYFGYSVSLSSDGNTALVGAVGEDTGASNAGAAYIFTRSSGTWTQQQKIQASDAQASDDFGYSVSLSSDGNTALVGAYLEDPSGTDAGAAYIFTRSSGTWTQQQKIQASDAQDSDNFGRSVSLSSDGNTALIGAYREDTGGTDAGAGYIFTLSGGTWTQQLKIQASDAQGSDEFGHSVSLSSDGNTAIVSAYREDTGGTDAGAAYIFTSTGTPGSESVLCVDTTLSRVGVGTATPNYTLDVAGDLTCSGTMRHRAFAFYARASGGQIVANNGILSDSNSTITTEFDYTPAGTASFNGFRSSGGASNNQGTYFAPVDGIYHVSCKVRLNDSSTAQQEIQWYIKRTNGNEDQWESFEMWISPADGGGRRATMSSTIVKLAKDEGIFPRADNPTTSLSSATFGGHFLGTY